MRVVGQEVIPLLVLFITFIHGASIRRVRVVDNTVEGISSELFKSDAVEISKQHVFPNTVECDCGKNSRSCEFDKDGKKVCHCQAGHAERNGTCTATCTRQSDCVNGRICTKEGNGNFCVCPPNFRGEKCEVNELCEKLVPSCESQGAYCVFNNSEAACQCPVGQNMSLRSGKCEGGCNSTCVHGTCEVSKMGFYECRCEDMFLGINCDEEEPNKYGFPELIAKRRW